MYRKAVIISFIVLTIACLPTTVWPANWRADDVSRVVAIADIHGAYNAMVETLQNASILGDDLSWTGDQAHLVIVGDILDRGPKSRAAMDLLMRLEGEASAAGGRVHILIGNHESMILTGDMRYVSDAEYAAFADEEDSGERERGFELYIERLGGDADSLRGKFDDDFPPGYFAMRRAFRADGYYGRWLLSKNIIVVIDGTAFVHGGLSPNITRIGLIGVNKILQQELTEYVTALNALTDAGILRLTDSHYDYAKILGDYIPGLSETAENLRAIKDGIRLDSSDLIASDGPLWYRSNVICPGIVEEHRLDAALAAIGAERVVVGHTPTASRKVMQRFGGRLIEIDTGMLNFYYAGSGHALVIENGSMFVIGQHGVEPVDPAPHPRSVGRRPNGLTTGELTVLLEHGDVVSIEESMAGALPRTIVTIGNGEHTIRAIFNKRKSKGFYPSVAAFRMDQLLELDMVPVTVRRKIDGKDGSLQFFPANSIDELSRSASGSGGEANCVIPDQWAAMYVFDVLLHNEGRSRQRMLYDLSSWRLILSEHERAFAARKGRPAHLKKYPLVVSRGWKNALTELDDDVLASNLGDVLDKRRLRALASRRDELIATP